MCVSPSNVTGTGVTRLPSTRPVLSSTNCAYTLRLVPVPEYVSVSCGAGGSQVGTTTVTASGGSFVCSFPDGPASPTVSVQVKDSDNANSNTATQTVTVANVPPVITSITPAYGTIHPMSAAVNVVVNGGVLRDASGSPLPPGSLVAVVASTQDDAFASPIPASPLQAGTAFVDPDHESADDLAYIVHQLTDNDQIERLIQSVRFP